MTIELTAEERRVLAELANGAPYVRYRAWPAQRARLAELHLIERDGTVTRLGREVIEITG